MSYNDMLAEKRDQLKASARAIIETAGAEQRNLTRDEQARFDEALTNLRAMDEQKAHQEGKTFDVRASEESLRRLADQPVERRDLTASAEDRAIEDKFRSAILEKNPAPIVVADPSPRSYYQPGLEARAIGVGSPANTSTGVGFYGKIVANLVETSAVLRAGARVLTTNSGEPMRIPRQTAYSSGSLVAEAAAIPEADPTMSAVTLGAFKYAVLITVSNELVEDAGFDLKGYLAAESGIALGNALGSDLINGTGSGAPRGVLLDATLGVTGPTGTSTSFGTQGTAGQGTDLINSLVGSLAEPYTRSAAAGFLTRTGTLTAVRNLKSTQGELVGNQYLANSPAPWHVDPYVPALAANAKSVLYGDWSRYFVRMVNGIRFEQSRDYAFNTDQTVFRAVLRADGALIDTTGAIKYFANSAT